MNCKKNKSSKLILSNWFSMAVIKIGQQKQEKQNTFNENLKNKASDPEKITDMNWRKYKLRFWRCNKSFLQMVFCTKFCKLCTFFWYQFKLQQKLSYLLIFKTNMFFPDFQNYVFAQSTLNWYGWKPLFSGNSVKKTAFDLMCMHHQNLSSKLVSWKKNQFQSNASSTVPTDVTFLQLFKVIFVYISKNHNHNKF